MISSVRSPENSHIIVIARTSSSGYHGVPVPPRLACSGRSSAVRFSPAHISFAHTSSAITRGAGPISARIERGNANARRALNRRSIHSDSWMSLKNLRGDHIRCAFVRGSNWPPERRRM